MKTASICLLVMKTVTARSHHQRYVKERFKKHFENNFFSENIGYPPQGGLLKILRERGSQEQNILKDIV